ncbi:hypothetical protein MHK_010476, partial [Candidatus Magnetomorum sp. HK-1]
IHMRYFPTFEDLKEKVNESFLKFEESKQEILNLFGFYTKKATVSVN